MVIDSYPFSPCYSRCLVTRESRQTSSFFSLSYFVKAKSGNSSTGRDIASVILRNIQPVIGGEAITAPDSEKAFPNHVSKLSAATDGCRLAIHGNLEFTGTVLAAYPGSVRITWFEGLGNDEHKNGFELFTSRTSFYDESGRIDTAGMIAESLTINRYNYPCGSDVHFWRRGGRSRVPVATVQEC